LIHLHVIAQQENTMMEKIAKNVLINVKNVKENQLVAQNVKQIEFKKHLNANALWRNMKMMVLVKTVAINVQNVHQMQITVINVLQIE